MLFVNVFSFYVISSMLVTEELRSYSRMDGQRFGLCRGIDQMGCEELITVSRNIEQ